ncbi:MAG TPA: LysM peptidoglycan-binding domain-containing protein [Arenibaculum sp.]|nr:LysM peptidoglycan-binding domain-containing protein [Arenibaculum sp.]
MRRIIVGLVVAVLGLPLALSAQPAAAQSGPCGERVTIAVGDTLYGISRRCGVSLDTLLAANPHVLNGSLVIPGMPLVIQSRSQPPRPGPGSEQPTNAVGRYIVRPGDTVAAIARMYRVPMAEIFRLNPNLDARFLRVGDVLRVPGGIAPPEPPSQRAGVDITPRRGGAGTIVSVTGSGFGRQARLRLLVGTTPERLRDIGQEVRADWRGNAAVTVRIPAWAANERSMVFGLETLDGRQRAVSSRFEIVGIGTPGPARISVTGTLTREGVECQAMRGDDGRLYTFQRRRDDFRPGDRVIVDGHRVEVSSCQQGTTIDVGRIEEAR